MRKSRATEKGPNQDAEAGQESIDLAQRLARVLDRRKGDHIEILDLRQITVIADCFVFVSGFARVQIQALADAVLEEARVAGHRCRSAEGYEDSGWILLDFGDVIVHLLTEESRDYYRLDRLWGDAPRIRWIEGQSQPAGTARTADDGPGEVIESTDESRVQ